MSANDTERCHCGDEATNEIQPPNPDRDDWIPVCDTHTEQLRHISGAVRSVDTGETDE